MKNFGYLNLYDIKRKYRCFMFMGFYLTDMGVLTSSSVINVKIDVRNIL